LALNFWLEKILVFLDYSLWKPFWPSKKTSRKKAAL